MRLSKLRVSDEIRQKYEQRMVHLQITPDSQISNQHSERILRGIHSFKSVAQRLRNRKEVFQLEREPFLSYEVVLRRKDAEFYLTALQDDVEGIQQGIETVWGKSAVEEATDPFKSQPVHSQLLEYNFPYMFSLRIDRRRQNGVLESLLEVTNHLDDEEQVYLQIIGKPAPHDWYADAVEHYKQFKQGYIPKKWRWNKEMLTNVALKAVAKTVLGAHNTLLELVGSEPEEYDLDGQERAMILKDGSLRRETLTKTKGDAYSTSIRLAIVTENPEKVEYLARMVSTSFRELDGDNQLTDRKKNCWKHMKQRTIPFSFYDDYMSADELSQFICMPTLSLQERFGIQRVKAEEAFIPDIFIKGNGMLIGHAKARGVTHEVRLPIWDRDKAFRSYVFQGSQGMGKDTAIKNFVVEACLNFGIASIIPDAIDEPGHRGMANGIRDALPPEKVIDLNLADTEYPIPLDLAEVIAKLGEGGANRFATEMIDFFGDVESMGQSRKILRSFAKASAGSIYKIKLLLESEKYRLQCIRQLREQGQARLANDLDFWTSEYTEDSKGNVKVVRDGQKALEAKGVAVLNRLDELLGDDVLYRIFAQPNAPDLNFEKWIAEGKVVILRMPNKKLGALATKTLMHWVTLKTFMTKMLMENPEKGVFLVYNEPHQYMSPGLEKLLQRVVLEGRKWRVGSLYAFHHIGLLPKTFADDLQASGTNWFLFSNTHKQVFERLSEELHPTFDIKAAMQIPQYHAIALLQFGEYRQKPFLFKGLPPTNERLPIYENDNLTLKHAKQYGRHWQEVEDIIAKYSEGEFL